MKSCNCCTTYSAPDLMDGGVTAALIEKEVAGSYTRTDEEGTDTRTREHLLAEEERAPTYWRGVVREYMGALEKAEQERDEARKKVAEYVSLLAAPLAHPLTADDISEQMVTRFMVHEHGVSEQQAVSDEWADDRSNARESLTAALTEPTPEPTDTERLADVLRRFPGRLAGIRDIADHLASEGVRVTGAES